MCKTKSVHFLHQVIIILLCNEQNVIFTIGNGTHEIVVLSNAKVFADKILSICVTSKNLEQLASSQQPSERCVFIEQNDSEKMKLLP